MEFRKWFWRFLIVSLAGCGLTSALWFGLVKPEITRTFQVRVINATYAKSLPKGVAEQPAEYVRKLNAKGNETRLVLSGTQPENTLEFTVAAKDYGPYWATTELVLPGISRCHKVTNVQVKDGNMTIELQRKIDLPIVLIVGVAAIVALITLLL